MKRPLCGPAHARSGSFKRSYCRPATAGRRQVYRWHYWRGRTRGGNLGSQCPHRVAAGFRSRPGRGSGGKSSLDGSGSADHIDKRVFCGDGRCALDLGWERVDGILLDLGVSSRQLEQDQRGFSFLREGPLDMRFDQSSGLKAKDILNRCPQNEIAQLLSELGEERQSKKIARAVVKARPIDSTLELARIVAEQKSGKKGRRHAATKTFQALRMAVNAELDVLRVALPLALDLLVPGGRLAVIAFHSLEDRIVKQVFRRESRDCLCLPEQIVCACSHRASIREVMRRPIKPTADEVTRNRRSRSARLRIAEKL